MNTRQIGSLQVSAIGLGCNNFGMRLDAAGTAAVVHAAIDAGITFFDTADVYGGTKSEEFLGPLLRERRKDVVIATKFGSPVEGQGRGARPEYIRQAVAASLRRLGTDYIDLYQLHIPDADVPIADTVGALNELVRAGTVREIGCSNFSAAQLREARGAAAQGSAAFASVQNNYSLLHREPESEVLPQCERDHLSFLPFFPLANGLLTGKYRKGQPSPSGTRIADMAYFKGSLTPENLEIVEKLIAFAESRSRTILDLAFSWLLSRPAVASVIAGATSPQQVRANAATGAWRLRPADLEELDRLVPTRA
jgi:aryl-alcohol dehydrogenase-like predicted oxidoreductase